jgi:hypothetical protein
MRMILTCLDMSSTPSSLPHGWCWDHHTAPPAAILDKGLGDHQLPGAKQHMQVKHMAICNEDLKLGDCFSTDIITDSLKHWELRTHCLRVATRVVFSTTLLLAFWDVLFD